MEIVPDAGNPENRNDNNDHLTKSELRYRRFFESVKDGILILDHETGKILDVNPSFIELSGFPRGQFFGKMIWEIGFFKEIVSSRSKYAEFKKQDTFCYDELQIQTEWGRRIFVDLVSNVYAEGEKKVIQWNIRDVTKRRQKEFYTQISIKIHALFNTLEPLDATIKRALELVKKETDYHATAIRFKQGEDFPFFVYNGFTDDFILSENSITEKTKQGMICRDSLGNPNLECTCGLVISGKTDPGNPLFTSYGSFWTNCSTDLLELKTGDDPRLHPRNRCIHEGFLSFALIPIRVHGNIIGLLQLNDRRKDRFTPEIIKNFEDFGEIFGVALNRRIVEEKLKASEEKFRTIFDNVQDIFYQIDLSGIILEISPSIKQFSGYDREEVIGQNISTIYYRPEDRNDMLNSLKNKHVLKDYEVKFKLKDGEINVGALNATLILNDQGQPFQIVGAIKDITKRKKAEEHSQQLLETVEKAHKVLLNVVEDQKMAEAALRNSEVRVRTLLQAIPDLIWLKDTEGAYLACNRMFERYIGAKEADLLGKTDYDLVDRDLADSYTLNDREAIAAGKAISNEEWITFADDGHKAFLEIIKMPMYDSERTLKGVLGVGRDLTGRILAQAELVKAKEKAEESDRLKSAFLANMSHEIRTPMNGILGFAELLKDPDLTGEEQKNYIRIIEKSGDRMLNIINDIVNISKVESGQMEIQLSEINVNEQIEFIYTFFKPECEQNGLGFSCHIPATSEAFVIQSDREKFYSIITNLIKNAIKFTHQGSIEFGFSRKGDYLEFFVNDTGDGILPQNLDIIFQRFRQGSESLTRNYEGAGLGLAISKAYVEMLGGTIWVKSEFGKGSEFYFTIPYIGRAEEPDDKQKLILTEDENSRIRNLNILIAEDDEISGKLITALVKSFANEIQRVRTGLEAVEACRNNSGFDLILMDVKMPEMDGYSATREIRQFNKHIIIIAQTAFGLSGDREKAVASGCNDYISKPFTKASLTLVLKKYFEK